MHKQIDDVYIVPDLFSLNLPLDSFQVSALQIAIVFASRALVYKPTVLIPPSLADNSHLADGRLAPKRPTLSQALFLSLSD